MANFNVRVYGHAGIEQMILNKPKQFSSDSVFQLVQPYIFGQTIAVSPAAASSSSNSDARVTVLRIEVASPNAIRYEINPPNREGGPVVANVNSPLLTGNDQFYFRAGWSVSMIDASGLP